MRGVIFNMNCGKMTGGTCIKTLAKPCLNTQRTTRIAHGQRIVDQLSRGVMPESRRRHFGVWLEERLQAMFS